jgi:hypothetical protein
MTVRLRDDTGLTGDPVAMDTDGVVTVLLRMTGWPPGEARLVWLEASVDTGSSSVWPVRAVGA